MFKGFKSSRVQKFKMFKGIKNSRDKRFKFGPRDVIFYQK